MMVLSMEAITQWVASLLWPLFRVGAFFMTVPLFGSQLVPVRIRLYLSVIFTIMLWPMIDTQLWPLVSLSQALIISLEQLLIGLAMGLMVQVLFQIPAIAGQIISMQNGLGFAMMVDPVNGVSVASIGQLYLLMANLLFLAMNGHLVTLQVLAASFETLAIGRGSLSLHDFYQLILQGSWMFSAALLIALPAITALLLVNLAFGLMARLAPQLNIFSVGFPFSMMFGLLVLWGTLNIFLPQFSDLSEHALLLLRDMVR